MQYSGNGITGDRRSVELQPDLAVEIDANGVVLAFTHEVPRSFWQVLVGNAGNPNSRVSAQVSCQNGRAIWEIRAYRTCLIDSWAE